MAELKICSRDLLAVAFCFGACLGLSGLRWGMFLGCGLFFKGGFVTDDLVEVQFSELHQFMS